MYMCVGNVVWIDFFLFPMHFFFFFWVFECVLVRMHVVKLHAVGQGRREEEHDGDLCSGDGGELGSDADTDGEGERAGG